MNVRTAFRRGSCLGCAVLLIGCGGASPPIPPTAAVTASAADAQTIFDACLQAHGGAAAYARLQDVNVRFDSHWATVGPRLQPVLSDREHRGGSVERYVPVRGGFIVSQLHHGPAGAKTVTRGPQKKAASQNPLELANVAFNPDLPPENRSPNQGFVVSSDPEVRAAAGLVTDAYSMFLFGPKFFVQRGAKFQKLDATAEVQGHACDELVTTLSPGLGTNNDDRVVLYIDRENHLLRRVQFTLNALESTKGAEVHVDLMDHRQLAGVMWPTRYSERIDRPVNLPAHQWQLLGFDVNRGNARDRVSEFIRLEQQPPKTL